MLKMQVFTCIKQERCRCETARLTRMLQVQQHHVLCVRQSSAARRLASQQKGLRCGFYLPHRTARMGINICCLRQCQDSWNMFWVVPEKSAPSAFSSCWQHLVVNRRTWPPSRLPMS